jgi:hypothetical protein
LVSKLAFEWNVYRYIVEPDVAVFGKKDYQQWRIIRRMVRRRGTHPRTTR